MSEVGESNPYVVSGSPAAAQYAQPAQLAQDHGFQAIQPLVESAWWLKLLGWTFIVLGGIQCLTIVGIIVGWLPIWMGFLLKNAGEKVAYGQQSRSWQSVYDGCKDLKTYFVILGVLMLINICILAMYLLAIVVILILGIVAGVASNA